MSASLREFLPRRETVADRKGNDKTRYPIPRSTRYWLEAPALFWESGSDRSHGKETRTKNISRTGLYLYGELDGPIGTSFEFEVRLPAPVGGTGGMLRGQGKLVRKETVGEERVGFAAVIYLYEFRSA